MADETKDVDVKVLTTTTPIAACAAEFMKQCVHPDASDRMQHALVEAFWTGAAAMFGMVTSTSRAPSPEEGAQFLHVLEQELEDHGVRIEVGVIGTERAVRRTPAPGPGFRES